MGPSATFVNQDSTGFLKENATVRLQVPLCLFTIDLPCFFQVFLKIYSNSHLATWLTEMQKCIRNAEDIAFENYKCDDLFDFMR